jgi:hypothetical protein
MATTANNYKREWFRLSGAHIAPLSATKQRIAKWSKQVVKEIIASGG